MNTSANKKEPTSHYDIIVVGAGLVGASFVALLAKWQADKNNSPLRIALIDAGKAPSLPAINKELDKELNEESGQGSNKNAQFDPRVVALTQASQSLLSSLGLWEKIQQQRACAYHHMHVWDHDGTANIQFSAQEIQQQQLGHIVENSILQCTLLDYLAEQPCVNISHGVKVDSLVVGNNAVVNKEKNTAATGVVTTLLCDDGTSLSADLIVAADGGQSTIRRLANMDTREWDYYHKAIVATVRSSQSHQYTAWQNFLPSGPLAFLPLDHPSKQYCSIVWSLESEKADEMMALNDDDFCYAVSRALQHRLGDAVSVSQRYTFPLHQRHAIHYVNDNIVLMGDAAHTIHPLAGQGVNLGLLDAQALAQEIIRGVERELTVNEPSVLRRYQRQRKANNVEVMLLMEGLKRLFGHKNIAVRWLRNVGLKKVNELTLLKNWLAKQAIKHK
jgi:2-octaprenylphenol hydroxylase